MTEQVHDITDLPKEPSKVQKTAVRIGLVAAAAAIAIAVLKAKQSPQESETPNPEA